MGRVTLHNEYEKTGTSVVYSRSAVYNSKSQVTSDVVTAVRSDGTWVTTTTYDYNAETSPGSGVFTGAYQGGAITHQHSTITKIGDARLTLRGPSRASICSFSMPSRPMPCPCIC